MKKYFLSLACTVVLMQACKHSADGTNETTTKGHITIAVDESFRPIMEAEEQVFEALYPDADLNHVYTSETDAIRMLLNDSARLAVVTRKLTESEEKFLKDQTFVPRYYDIAYDGITFILHKNNPDSVFTIAQLSQILAGTSDDWSKINPASKMGKLNVVFDSRQSGAIRYLKDSLLQGKDLGKNCFAVNSNPEVIEYVQNNPGSIGIIGSSWISDREDTSSLTFLKSITVASLVPYHPETAEAAVMKPFQAYIALKQYPLWRKVVVISRETRAGLGSGYVSFIVADQGQRIIYKAGIVPATAPVRLIHVK